jgi:SulP family sulfate permease
VIVAIAGFYRVDEFRRFARIRTSALVFASVALVGVLLLGVLQGLIVAAGLSLIVVIQRLSRPSVSVLARDPETGAWGRTDRHPDWPAVPGVVFARVDGPLFYANAVNVKERLLALAGAADPRPAKVVLDLSESPDLDVETLDALAELARALKTDGIEFSLASVRVPVLALLERSGVAAEVRVEPTLAAAIPS